MNRGISESKEATSKAKRFIRGTGSECGSVDNGPRLDQQTHSFTVEGPRKKKSGPLKVQPLPHYRGMTLDDQSVTVGGML